MPTFRIAGQHRRKFPGDLVTFSCYFSALPSYEELSGAESIWGESKGCLIKGSPSVWLFAQFECVVGVLQLHRPCRTPSGTSQEYLSWLFLGGGGGEAPPPARARGVSGVVKNCLDLRNPVALQGVEQLHLRVTSVALDFDSKIRASRMIASEKLHRITRFSGVRFESHHTSRWHCAIWAVKFRYRSSQNNDQNNCLRIFFGSVSVTDYQINSPEIFLGKVGNSVNISR